METITLTLTNPSSILKIHAKSPLIINKILKLPENQELVYQTQLYDITLITLPFEVLGELKVLIEFELNIGEDPRGCYICNQKEEKMITTHFEPTYAREAIPCLDEPGFKSTFNLSIKVNEDFHVISNMPRKLLQNDGLNDYTFETTPYMSCYLLHWTICKHNKIETQLNNTTITLYARDTRFSKVFLDLAKDSLNYFNSLFDIPYPLPKMDLVSVFSNL